jgi:ferredoxin
MEMEQSLKLMKSNLCQIVFPHSNYSPLTIPVHEPLALYLNPQNSPILFGCRTGICGTCLVSVDGETSPPDSAEQEVLRVLAPDNPRARLACQLDVTHDLALIPI